MINQVLKIATGLFFVVFAASESAAQAPADWKIFEYEAGLLRNHLVREELQISEPQARKIKKEYNKFFEKLNLIKRIHLPRAVEGSTEFDALIEEGNELIAGARSKLDETALGFQQKRLTQLANQFDRWKETGIEIKGLKKDLGITKSQEEKISKANDDFAKELKELKASYEAKFERLLKKNIKDLSDPLDVEQKKPVRQVVWPAVFIDTLEIVEILTFIYERGFKMTMILLAFALVGGDKLILDGVHARHPAFGMIEESKAVDEIRLRSIGIEGNFHLRTRAKAEPAIPSQNQYFSIL